LRLPVLWSREVDPITREEQVSETSQLDQFMNAFSAWEEAAEAHHAKMLAAMKSGGDMDAMKSDAEALESLHRAWIEKAKPCMRWTEPLRDACKR
jgi:thiamine kinase-like enzyme